MTNRSTYRRHIARLRAPALVLGLALAFAFVGCTDTTRPDAHPPDAAPESTPADASGRSVAPAELATAVDSFLGLAYTPYYRNLRTLLVSVDGEIWLERNHGRDPAGREDGAGVADSIVSLLVGVALDRGRIDSLGDTVADLLPADGRGTPASVRQRTLRELLTTPTGAGRVLVRIVEEASGRSLPHLARTQLLRPLGIDADVLRTDRAGRLQLGLSASDLLRLGQLVLDGGRVEDRQVVPAGWVSEATGLACEAGATGTVDGRRHAPELGRAYQWWTTRADSHRATAAFGDVGPLVEVVPGLDLVVVATTDGRQAQRSQPLDYVNLVNDVIAPALDR